jgi:3-phenylpropionate/cinnamic acid dioxygenase small subunit
VAPELERDFYTFNTLNDEEKDMIENDKAAIIEVLNLYAFALDARQWDLFDRVFADDVIAEFGPAGAAWTGLANFKRSFAEFHERLDSHQHTMMGQLVHVEGDKAHAFSYGNWLLIRNAAEGGSSWMGTGWYDDELVRTDRGWRIQRRVCKLQSWSGNPLVPEPDGDHNPDMNLNVLNRFAEAGEIGFLKAIQEI